MKGRPARVFFVLAATAAAFAAAASDRFVPADPHFVVANVRQATPDAELRGLIEDWRVAPGDAATVALARAFLDRARTLREPVYFGRAESVLAAAARRPGASFETRRLWAETLQSRHEFPAAERLLDGILRQSPLDAGARTQRASIRLVRGDFAGARADCALLMTSGASRAVALACLAESLAGMGHLEQARALLDAYPLDPSEPAVVRAYLLTVRAELAERASATDRAVADYGAALSLAPLDDSIRASLADALVTRGEPAEADALLRVDRPSLALVVRRAGCAGGTERARLHALASSWLELEAARGDALHNREAAMLALQEGDPVRALAAAEKNFDSQKELPDVRVLARATIAVGDPAARARLAEWLRTTGFADAVTEEILGARRGG